MDETLSISHEVFPHVRVVMGIVVGLALTRLLSGIARVVQHPRQHAVYAVHMLWVLAILVMLVHFWWWEFALYEIKYWSFARYLFVVAYAIALFLLCAFLFPESMVDYRGYEDFFYAKKTWFFGLLATVFGLDIIDTLMKGMQHLELLGVEYYVRTPVMIALSICAMRTDNRRFHWFFAVFTILYQLVWVNAMFDGVAGLPK